MKPNDSVISQPDPFAKLPMRFVLTEDAICQAESIRGLKYAVEALIDQALKKGFGVIRTYDPETSERAFVVHDIANADVRRDDGKGLPT